MLITGHSERDFEMLAPWRFLGYNLFENETRMQFDWWEVELVPSVNHDVNFPIENEEDQQETILDIFLFLTNILLFD